MTDFDPETVELGAELDRLAERADDLEAEREGVEAGTERASELTNQARDTDQAGRAVAALVEEYGADATVTVRGLSAGEYAKVENKTAEAKANATAGAGVPGTGKLVFAAAGTVDAPFFDDDTDGLEDKIGAIACQSIGVRKWLETIVSDRTAVGEGNWRDSAGSHSESTDD